MDFQNYDDVFNVDNYPKFRNIEKQDTFLNKGYSIIPNDYAPCLCLSGKKFKFCCKEKFKQTFKGVLNGTIKVDKEELYPLNDKKLLSRKTENKSISKKNISYCFAKNIFDDCSNENVHSHTMAKGNVLKNLSNGDKVIKFDDHSMIDNISINDIDKLFKEATISEASTTVSFCKNHDVLLFEDIEKDGNTTYRGSYIENLEYALKAATFDLYYNIMKIKYMSELFDQNIKCANNDFFDGYEKDISALFKIYPLAKKILVDIKNYKENNTEENDFKTISIRLPFDKVNYSLSETIPIGETICFLNVVNIPTPYIIISYYSQKKIDLSYSQKKIDLSETDDFGYEKFLYFTLSLTQNVYFEKNQFNKLSGLAKFFIYLIHRFGVDFLTDIDIKYSMTNQSFVNSISKIITNKDKILQEIINTLYIK